MVTGGLTVWLTGLPSAGKSTLAWASAERIGSNCEVLDGDNIRKHLFPELGFTREDRNENVRRAGRLALMLAKHNIVVFVAMIAPFKASRDWVRRLHESAGVLFAEVWVDAPLEVCEQRDVKSLYRRARQGKLPKLTGIDDPYEVPFSPDLHISTDQYSVDTGVKLLSELVTSLSRPTESYDDSSDYSRKTGVNEWSAPDFSLLRPSIQCDVPPRSSLPGGQATTRDGDNLLSEVGTGNVKCYEIGHLKTLESETIHIFREVLAELERPVLLFSGGKDSAVLLRTAEKAFWPARIPFPVMHIDTGHNFDEVLRFRNQRIAELDLHLIVASVPEAIERGLVSDPPDGSRNRIQTPVLLNSLEKYGFTAVFGGARRDEDKARAKERIYSFRGEFGQWDPRNQRPELWDLYNGRIHTGESIRIYPLSNWTELDIWRYIAVEELEVPSIYFAHDREVFEREGMIYAVHKHCSPRGAATKTERVRYRTIGDARQTAAIRSTANSVERIIDELAASRISERGATRGDDRFSATAMEDRKREGYF